MDATQARAISDGRAVEVANGIDPDTNEGIEYGDGGAGGTSPVTGEAGPLFNQRHLLTKRTILVVLSLTHTQKSLVTT